MIFSSGQSIHHFWPLFPQQLLVVLYDVEKTHERCKNVVSPIQGLPQHRIERDVVLEFVVALLQCRNQCLIYYHPTEFSSPVRDIRQLCLPLAAVLSIEANCLVVSNTDGALAAEAIGPEALDRWRAVMTVSSDSASIEFRSTHVLDMLS